jgi:hypothetical protein
MADPDDRSRDERKLGKDFYERGLDLLVEMLAIRANANTTREELKDRLMRRLDPFGIWRKYLEGVTAADLRSVVFDLARLQVDTLQDVTRISQRYTEHVGKRLEEYHRKREAREPRAAARTRQAVCLLEWEASRRGYHGIFSLGDGVTREEEVVFPEVVTVRPSDGSGEFPVTARFIPATAKLEPGKTTQVSVVIPEDPWLKTAVRYQATLLLGTASGAPVCLFLRFAPG